VVLTAASAGFEAARQVDVLPAGHRCRALHGHGFQATVYAELPAGWAPFPGGEVEALEQRLQQAVAPLNYSHLNPIVDTPTDENLARWVREALGQPAAVPGIHRVAIQSTAHQGVDLDRHGHAHVWRRFRFQAAHQLPRVPLGHKCGRMHGHGFEAIVHANAELGARPLSVDYDHIDALWAPLHMQLNYRCLNEIEGLDNPTSEMISAWIWARLKPVLPELSWVTVFETASCGANFDGASYRIWKDFTLDSAVQLKRAPTGMPEGGLHGHTFKLRLHLNAPIDTVMGWTIDFGDVKTIFDPVFKALDHQPLHEVSALRDADTASIAEWIYTTTKIALPQLARVDLFETAGCGSILAQDIGGPALPV
jgi:6-pyruvoyltetrahydropterin/6-carboxytetrahydropterin synthase